MPRSAFADTVDETGNGFFGNDQAVALCYIRSMEIRGFDLQPTLVGNLIQVRPIRENDFKALYACANDPEIWRQHPQSNRYQRKVFIKYFEGALASKGGLIVTDLATQQIIGSSRYYDLNRAGGHVTIGYTFLTRPYWGGKFNRELKALMIGHALQSFEFVLFEVGDRNIRSKAAIEKIGAHFLKRETRDENPHVIYRMDRNQFKQAFP